jgi:hypothetical protein
MGGLSGCDFRCIGRDSVHDSRNASKRTDVGAGGGISGVCRIHGSGNRYGVIVGGGSSSGCGGVVGGEVGGFGGGYFGGVGNRLGWYRSERVA